MFLDKFTFFFQTLKKHVPYVAGILCVEVVVAGMNAVIPYFTKLQVDQLQSHSTQIFFLKNLSPLMLFGSLLLIPAFLELLRLALFDRISRRTSLKFETALRLDVEKKVWEKLSHMDAGFFENNRNQRILASMFDSTGIVAQFFNFLRSRLGNVVTLIAIIPLLGFLNQNLLILVAVATMLQMFLTETSRKREIALNTLQEHQREKYWKVSRALSSNFIDLKNLGATEEFLEKYRVLSLERDDMEVKRQHADEVVNIFQWLITNGLTVSANLFVGYEVITGHLSLGTFTLVVSYTMQLSGIFRDFLESVRAWRDIDLQYDRLQFFFFLKPRIKSLPPHLTEFSAPQKIELKSIHFTYPTFFEEEREYLELIISKTKGFLDQFSSYYYRREFEEWKEMLSSPVPNKPILNGVDMLIQQGKIVALLGRNGAGKTTITNLMLHHYEPTSGTIKLDEKNLETYQQNALLRQFAVIHQVPFILEQFSVRENLLLGVQKKLSDEEIWGVLEKIDLKKAIDDLPHKLDTILGEGFSLSGGQMQLVAVARVLLQQRPFLIFDEGMNQMDIEHETKVVSLLKEQSRHAGVLFITHRITTARKADHIYMLDEGKIAEQGSHEQLLKANGLYAKFWNMQVIE